MICDLLAATRRPALTSRHPARLHVRQLALILGPWGQTIVLAPGGVSGRVVAQAPAHTSAGGGRHARARGGRYDPSVAQRKTLTENQVAVLRWIADGCPEGVMPDDDYHHRIGAGLLRLASAAHVSI
jgi:hypothetical protein